MHTIVGNMGEYIGEDDHNDNHNGFPPPGKSPKAIRRSHAATTSFCEEGDRGEILLRDMANATLELEESA